MKVKGKKFVSLLLVFSLVALSGNLMAKEKKGANLLVTKKDGQQVAGELITVKPASLLLLNTDGRDETVDVADINEIKIVKKSRTFAFGAGAALFGGIISGVLQGEARRERLGYEESQEGYFSEPLTIAAIAGAGGALIGTVVGIDKKIKIEGKSDTQVSEALRKLSKKARVPDYQ